MKVESSKQVHNGYDDSIWYISST